MENNGHLTRDFMLTTALESTDAFSSLGAGEIGLFRERDNTNVTGTVSTATLDGSPVFFAQKLPSTLQTSSRFSIKTRGFNPKDIERIVIRTYTAPVAEVWNVGYVGSGTGTIGMDCETEYGIKVVLSSPYINKYYGNAGKVFTGRIFTDCCATCDAGCGTADPMVEGAKFAAAFYQQDSHGNVLETPATINNYVSTVLLTNGTFTANNGSGFTMTVVNGSKSVTTSGAHGLAVGDLVRIGGTAATVAVYAVESVPSTTTLTLNIPFQGASATTIAASWGVITAATLIGLKFTSKFLSSTTGCCCFPPYPWDVEGTTLLITDSLISSFPCGFTPTKTTSLSYGVGTGSQILYDEAEAMGFSDKREWFKSCEMNDDYASQVTASSTYDVAYVYFKTPVYNRMSGWDANYTCLTIANVSSGAILQSGGPGALYTFLKALATYANAPMEYNGAIVGL